MRCTTVCSAARSTASRPRKGSPAPARSSSLSAQPAARVVQTYVGAVQDAVERFGGVVNKLDVADEGIKLVAVFGAPAAYEDHAERAALAALEMQERLPAVNQQITNLLQIVDRGWR